MKGPPPTSTLKTNFKTRFKTLFKPLLERLRLKLLAEERMDDPRHARGRSKDGNRVMIHGSLRRASRVEGLPSVLEVPPEALQVVRPELCWQVTPELEQAVALARVSGHQGVIVALELADCLYSVRLAEALATGQALWAKDWTLLRLQPGGRLNKAWIRQLLLGDSLITLTSLPLVLVLRCVPEGLRLTGLALDPLGPSRGHQRLRQLLAGVPQLAAGAQQEKIQLEVRGQSLTLEASNGFGVEAHINPAPGHDKTAQAEWTGWTIGGLGGG